MRRADFVAKTERLHCLACEDAFTTSSSVPGAWRCPNSKCGSRLRLYYHDRGELQQSGAWYCAECGEDSYATVKPSKKPGRQPPVLVGGAEQWGLADRLAELVPVGLALALVDPMDAAVWVNHAVRGETYQQIAALVVEETAAREPRSIVSRRADGIVRIATTRGPFRMRCHGCGSMNRTVVGTCAVCWRPDPAVASLPRSYGSVGRAVQRAREAFAKHLDLLEGDGIRFRRPSVVPGARLEHALVGRESNSPESHQEEVMIPDRTRAARNRREEAERRWLAWLRRTFECLGYAP